MKQGIWMSGVVLSLSLMLCVFSGCKKTDDGGSGGGSSAAPSASPAAAGQTAEWPSTLPKFADGKLMPTPSRPDNVFRGAMYTEIKNPQAAFERYKKALEEKGWTLDEDLSSPTNFVGEFVRGEADLHVSICKDGSLANLLYSPD